MFNELKTIPTIQLVDLLIEANKNNSQELVNIYAYELAKRIYVPTKNGATFEELLINFGYSFESKVEKEKEHSKVRKLTLK